MSQESSQSLLLLQAIFVEDVSLYLIILVIFLVTLVTLVTLMRAPHCLPVAMAGQQLLVNFSTN